MRLYYLVSVIIIAASIVPFLWSFERRRPAAREVVLLAVLVALAVASRAAFAWVPHFKPMAGIVMIIGLALGPRWGFLAGVLAAFTSGFIFGQGVWTPFQMLAFGSAGLVFGLMAGRIRHPLSTRAILLLAILGFAFVIVVLGPILDTCSAFMMLSRLTPEGLASIYLAGLPVNAIHASATALTLLLLTKPLLAQISRVCTKYGMGPQGAR